MNFSNFKKLLLLLNLKRRMQLFLLIIIMILAAFTEILGVGSIIPFLYLLIDPNSINNIFLIFLNDLSINLNIKIQLLITIICASSFILAAILRLSLSYGISNITFFIGSDLARIVFTNILNQSYEEQISRNSSDLVASLTKKIEMISYNSLLSYLNIISSFIILIGLSTVLILINTSILVNVLIVFICIYFLIILASKKIFQANGRKINENSSSTIKVLNEAIGGIKDIFIYNSQKYFINLFSFYDYALRKAQATSLFIAQLPRLLIESIGLAILITFIYFLYLSNKLTADLIPLFIVFAVCVQRILPLVQQIYHSYVNIEYASQTLDDIINLIDFAPRKKILKKIKINFQKTIELRNILFKYNNKKEPIFERFNFIIKKGSSVGIYGHSGAGKSTFLDLFMGLLLPTEGFLKVDNKIIDESNISNYRNLISHVPQNVYLKDDTIINNIVFGNKNTKINNSKLIEVSKLAELFDWINSLENGFDTKVGENGIAISGGQKQRIGIARALYKNSEILILDEATNALDQYTEKKVIENIKKRMKSLTMIMVTHRLSSLRGLSLIYELSKDRVLIKKKFNDIAKKNI